MATIHLTRSTNPSRRWRIAWLLGLGVLSQFRLIVDWPQDRKAEQFLHDIPPRRMMCASLPTGGAR